MFSVTGAIGWIVMGLWVKDLASAMIVKTVINVSSSFCNVIGEGIMVEMSRKHAKAKASLEAASDQDKSVYDKEAAATNVSLYLSLTAATSLCSSYLGGFLLKYYTD